MRVRALVSTLLLVCACKRSAPEAQKETGLKAPVVAQAEPKLELASIEKPDVKVPAGLDWLAFGGGSEPISNQVSLAQDLAVMASLVEGKGLTLFASGPKAPLALDSNPAPDAPPQVGLELAKLFGVPGADRTRYEPASLAIDGPSTTEHVLSVLERALASGTSPLFVYAASHGDRGDAPSDNALSLWGGWGLKVRDLAEVLDHTEHPRPTRFVITACYGGGFADLAFVGAEPSRGAREPDHCGLFAAPWDDEASGCDPNPDRRAQESYSIHFLHALSGRDRDGKLRKQQIDIDGDGQVSLLEAHTWARIQARSFDIPTTTSERFLRVSAKAPDNMPLDPLAAPEEVAVVRALGERLDLDDEAQARDQLAELERILRDAEAAVDEAHKNADDAYYGLRIALLERWPLLDHAWEPRAADVVRRDGPRILRLLTDSELAQAHNQALRELDEAVAQHDAVRVERARVLRLVRAYETLRLASALRKKGGPARAHYEALRTCERWVPPLRRGAR